MKKVWKVTSFMLVSAMLLSLCACGSSDSEGVSDSTENVTKESTTEAAEEKTEFKVGETWTVDGQWSVTVNSVEETEDRNEYADETPKAVYYVNYSYKNIGYEDSTGMMDGLYIAFDDMIVDAEGTMGYAYPNEYVYPQETPVGANCKAQSCVGVDNPGTFTITLDMYDSDDIEHEATFIMDPEVEAVENTESVNATDTSSALKIGDTWTVDGQWELTVTGVKATDERNEFEEQDPEAVYIVDYTYKNLGYEDSTGMMDGLYFDLESSIVDNKGAMGYVYSGDLSKMPEETPVGATCNAQACIGVDHAGTFTINVIQYDGNDKKQSQSFLCEVE